MYVVRLEISRGVETSAFELLGDMLDYVFGCIYEKSECRDLLTDPDKLEALSAFIVGAEETFEDGCITLGRA